MQRNSFQLRSISSLFALGLTSVMRSSGLRPAQAATAGACPTSAICSAVSEIVVLDQTASNTTN